MHKTVAVTPASREHDVVQIPQNVEAKPSPDTHRGDSKTLFIERQATSSSIVGDDPCFIQRLPIDLLIEIFLLCAPHEPPSIISSFRAPPLLFARVCRGWQKIAYDVPRLWSAVVVDLTDLGSEARSKLPSLLERWFLRAGRRPLTLKLNSRNCHDEKAGETLNTLLLRFAEQLSHLDIYSGRDSGTKQDAIGAYHYKSWPAFQFNQLVSAIVRDRIDVYHDENTALFPSASCLQRLRMDCLAIYGGTPVQLILPWSQLTHLVIGNPLRYAWWQKMFTMCPNLQYGVFSLYDTTEPSHFPVVFEHLVDLTIIFYAPANPSVLRFFHFPAIVTLRIKTDHWDIFDQTGWRRFREQLAPLRRLSICHHWQVQPFLAAAPQLVELDLRLTVMTLEGNLCCLLRDKAGHLLVPNLKVLIVDLLVKFQVQVNILAEIVKSRWYTESSAREGRGIKRLVLYVEDPDEGRASVDALKDKLRSCLDGGFLLDIKFTNPPYVDDGSPIEDLEPVHWSARLDPGPGEWREGLTGLYYGD